MIVYHSYKNSKFIWSYLSAFVVNIHSAFVNLRKKEFKLTLQLCKFFGLKCELGFVVQKGKILRFHLYSDYKPIVFNGKIRRCFLYGHKNDIHSKWLTFLNSHLDCPYWVQNMESYFKNEYMCACLYTCVRG